MDRSVKGLSDDTLKLVAQLRDPTLWERVTGSTSQVGLLDEIARRNEPASIVWLLDFLFSPHDVIAGAAAYAITRLMQSVPLEMLPWLDERCRTSYYWQEGRWRRMAPAQVARFRRADEDAVWLFGLASFHHNG